MNILNRKNTSYEIVLSEQQEKRLPPIICMVGFSGSGKTTLIERLIAELNNFSFDVGTIKHDVHGFQMDYPGKDTWRHKKAGASATIISSPSQIGMIMDVAHDHHPLELIHLLPGKDIVLAEGYKWSNLPKIEIFRAGNKSPSVCENDPNLLAVVSDITIDWGVPCYSFNNIVPLAELIIRRFDLASTKKSLCKQEIG